MRSAMNKSSSRGNSFRSKICQIIPALLAAFGLSSAANADDSTCPIVPLPAAAPALPGDRTTLFVSDLHMGVGKIDGKWHPTEDFRWHREFSDFLKTVNADSEKSIDLILVGDVFELWQTLEKDTCNYDSLRREIGNKALDLGCTETEAFSRFSRVRDQHQLFFDSVARFVVEKENRVVFLPGNHDAALLFPRLVNAVLESFPAQARNRVHVAVEGYWISADGDIFAEHGQQIGADPNCFQKWPKGAFIEHDGKSHLRKPWGEQFVQKLYNRHEEDFPTIDNMSEELRGAWYAIKARGVLGTLEELGRIIRFIFTQTSWDQTGQILGEDGIPVWKIDSELAKLDTSDSRWKFLVESRPIDDPLRVPFDDTDFSKLPEQAPFSREEVEAICDRRWLLVQNDAASGIVECESTGELGAIAEKIAEFQNPKEKDQRFRTHLTKIQKAIPAGTRLNTSFSLFVYGHTHKEQKSYAPFQTDAAWKPIVYNDGAWQRTATPETWCTIARSKGYSDVEALKKLVPEDLPACYPYVVVSRQGDNSQLVVRQLYWVQEPGDEIGSVKPVCSAIPDTLAECR